MRTAGEVLRHARREAGLTQSAVAGAAQIRQPLVSRVERDREQPSLPLLTRLVRACGYEIQLDMTLALDDHDRGLLAANLRLTPEQRIDRLTILNRVAHDLREAVQVARRSA
ncbi:MAG: helix-turn-helix transcriptional regulator [Candidatus Dormiibacterota bacterium]